MRPLFGSVGPRGLAVIAAAGLAGVLLAVHGWSVRASSAGVGSIGASPPGAVRTSVSPSWAAPSNTTGPTAGPTPSSRASAGSPGPLLSSQSFASYSFQVWPGTRSQAAQGALTGLSVSVHRKGTGISVTAGVSGQAQSAPHYYALGSRVYVVEASMGDDSGNSDFNLGDDGIIVTDADGRIVQ